ncbi:MAG: hypothetical protein P1S46_11850 [bacterium]|nr:hypothetical protein [bacterium]MDT8396334.1 hypothetical protein [bacterium]
MTGFDAGTRGHGWGRADAGIPLDKLGAGGDAEKGAKNRSKTEDRRFH